MPNSIRRSLIIAAAVLLIGCALLPYRAPSAAIGSSYEDGYADGLRAAGAGILLIEPEEYDFVLNLNKRTIHEAGKKCGPDVQYNTAYFIGTAEELWEALIRLGWMNGKSPYHDCGNCKPNVIPKQEVQP